MKQIKVVSSIGMLVVLVGTLFMVTGCRTGQESPTEKPVDETAKEKTRIFLRKEKA